MALDRPDYLEFVGVRALFNHGVPVIDKGSVDGRLLAAPPITRLLTTKMWEDLRLSDEEVETTRRMYALRLAQDYRSLPPMYAFAKAMYNDNPGKGELNQAAKIRMEYRYGELMEDDGTFPEPEVGNQDQWKMWASVTAGKFTNLEWATMCGLTTLKQHGFDLATYVPKSWLQA
jgi:hypothetical protein